MKKLAVDIDSEVFRTIKILTATEGITIREYIQNLILKDLESRKESE